MGGSGAPVLSPARHLPTGVHTGILGSPEIMGPASSLGRERNARQREEAGPGCPRLIRVLPGLEFPRQEAARARQAPLRPRTTLSAGARGPRPFGSQLRLSVSRSR